MRIHTSAIYDQDIYNAASSAGVAIVGVTSHGSRKRARAYEVKLSGSSNRRTADGQNDAALWDEWGNFISALYEIDSNAIIGDYPNKHYFDFATNSRYPIAAGDVCRAHKWNYDNVSRDLPYSVFSCGKCGAIRRNAPDVEAATAFLNM